MKKCLYSFRRLFFYFIKKNAFPCVWVFYLFTFRKFKPTPVPYSMKSVNGFEGVQVSSPFGVPVKSSNGLDPDCEIIGY